MFNEYDDGVGNEEKEVKDDQLMKMTMMIMMRTYWWWWWRERRCDRVNHNHSYSHFLPFLYIIHNIIPSKWYHPTTFLPFFRPSHHQHNQYSYHCWSSRFYIVIGGYYAVCRWENMIKLKKLNHLEMYELSLNAHAKPVSSTILIIILPSSIPIISLSSFRPSHHHHYSHRRYSWSLWLYFTSLPHH